jgi:hypothetical protein
MEHHRIGDEGDWLQFLRVVVGVAIRDGVPEPANRFPVDHWCSPFLGLWVQRVEISLGLLAVVARPPPGAFSGARAVPIRVMP